MSYASEVAADSPNVYCRLGDPSGTTCTLTVGSPNMTYDNTPTLGVTGALSGDSDTAVTFTAASSERAVNGGHQTYQDVADVFTVECWAKRADTGRAQSLMFNGGNSFDFKITAANQLGLDKAAAASIVSSTATITDTAWHHLVCTKNGATVKLYIDAVDVTGTVTNATFVNSTADFRIAHGNQGYFQGTMDEVAVYPTALSAARVLVHYNAGASSGTTYTKTGLGALGYLG